MRYGSDDRRSPFAVEAEPMPERPLGANWLDLLGRMNFDRHARTVGNALRPRESLESDEVQGLLAQASRLTRGEDRVSFEDEIKPQLDAIAARRERPGMGALRAAHGAAGLGLLGMEIAGPLEAASRFVGAAKPLAGPLARRAVGMAFPAVGTALLMKDIFDVLYENAMSEQANRKWKAQRAPAEKANTAVTDEQWGLLHNLLRR